MDALLPQGGPNVWSLLFPTMTEATQHIAVRLYQNRMSLVLRQTECRQGWAIDSQDVVRKPEAFLAVHCQVIPGTGPSGSLARDVI